VIQTKNCEHIAFQGEVSLKPERSGWNERQQWNISNEKEQ
jgi:hypothetical protein